MRLAKARHTVFLMSEFAKEDGDSSCAHRRRADFSRRKMLLANGGPPGSPHNQSRLKSALGSALARFGNGVTDEIRPEDGGWLSETSLWLPVVPVVSLKEKETLRWVLK